MRESTKQANTSRAKAYIHVYARAILSHQEVDHDRLHLCLPGLEVVAADVHLVLLRQLDDAGHEGVLPTTKSAKATERARVRTSQNNIQCWGPRQTRRLHMLPAAGTLIFKKWL